MGRGKCLKVWRMIKGMGTGFPYGRWMRLKQGKLVTAGRLVGNYEWCYIGSK